MDRVAADILPFRVALAQDVVFFSSRLKEAENALYSLQEDWRLALKKYFTPAEYQHLNRLVPIRETAGSQAVATVLKQMQAALAQLPSIDLKIAFVPSREFADRIVDWFDQYGPGPGRLGLQHVPSLVGGLVVGYQGRLYDLSLTQRINYERLSSVS